MSSCECMDEWVYYPTQFGQNQGMTFKGCDPIAPDFSGTTWCYLKGGESASSCQGAKQASGDIVGDQHYWATCDTSASDLATVAANAAGIDLSAKIMCAEYDGVKADCEAKVRKIISNCNDCMSDSSQAKCTLANQDISWNSGLSSILKGGTQSCAVLGSFFTNARA